VGRGEAEVRPLGSWDAALANDCSKRAGSQRRVIRYRHGDRCAGQLLLHHNVAARLPSFGKTMLGEDFADLFA